ncbi:MAG: hypothetical protein WCF98_11300 [Synechococcus sp. ELA057]
MIGLAQKGNASLAKDVVFAECHPLHEDQIFCKYRLIVAEGWLWPVFSADISIPPPTHPHTKKTSHLLCDFQVYLILSVLVVIRHECSSGYQKPPGLPAGERLPASGFGGPAHPLPLRSCFDSGCDRYLSADLAPVG